MSPQFVDFNADGKMDIVCGIFDGSPHVALGDGKTWQQPTAILDKDGERIVLNAFWNFSEKKWDETRRCDPDAGMPMTSGRPTTGHLTSAIAMDWDHDGDFDLVLGDYKGGYIYLRRNEGSNKAPQFATKNEVVMAGQKPMRDTGSVATIRSVDWDGDGALDLLVGSKKTGGRVVLYRNQGKGQATSFGEMVTLIGASAPKIFSAPERPTEGMHPEAVDFDSDGDLDLIVGGYSNWTPPRPKLSNDEAKTLRKLKSELEALNAKAKVLRDVMNSAAEGLEGEARKKKLGEIYDAQRPQHSANAKQRQALNASIQKLEPRSQRRSFTWLYENLARTPAERNSTGQR